MPLRSAAVPRGESILLSQVRAKLLLGTALSLFTSPLQVAAATLQITSPARLPPVPPWPAPLSAAEKETAKVLLQKQVIGFIELREPPRYSTYKAVFRSLGREGIGGFYKGNLAGLLHSSTCFAAKLLIFNAQLGGDQWAAGMQLIVSSLVDLLLQPLKLAQTRLICQKSPKNLRVYRGIAAVCASAWRGGELFQGWRAILPLNAVQACAFSATSGLRPDAALLLAAGALHAFGHPLMLAARRMEADTPSAGGRKDGARSLAQTLRKCLREEGLRGLYRGFLASTAVNAALLLVSVAARGQQLF